MGDRELAVNCSVNPLDQDAPMAETDAPDTEARILEAAHRVFLRRGTAGARTQEIADEAGVNKALLHYYFRTKDKLAEAVAMRAVGRLFPGILGALASDRPLREKLERVAAHELDMLEENPYLPGFLISEFQYQPERLRALLQTAVPLDERRAAIFGALQRQLDAEAEAGRLRPTRAEDLIVAVMGFLVFPFAAAPMLEAALGLDADARRAMAERRRADLPDLVLGAFAA